MGAVRHLLEGTGYPDSEFIVILKLLATKHIFFGKISRTPCSKTILWGSSRYAAENGELILYLRLLNQRSNLPSIELENGDPGGPSQQVCGQVSFSLPTFFLFLRAWHAGSPARSLSPEGDFEVKKTMVRKE